MGSTMKMSEDFSAFQKQRQKQRILQELYAKETSYPAELARLTNAKTEDVQNLLNELVSDKLVENISAKYYKLTYEGYRWVKNSLTRQTL